MLLVVGQTEDKYGKVDSLIISHNTIHQHKVAGHKRIEECIGVGSYASDRAIVFL
jgi:hypothetical protein